MVSQLLKFANSSYDHTEVELAGITNGKRVLLSSLCILFVYVQLAHCRHVLMVYCKQLLKGAQNIASASKISEASCCLFTENGARSSLRTYLLERRSTFV